MKALFNIISIIVKAIVIIMAIIGTVITIATTIIGKVICDHTYDVVEECDILDPDDEAQEHRLTAEAISRALDDPRVKDSKFINAVCYGVGRFISFVANL